MDCTPLRRRSTLLLALAVALGACDDGTAAPVPSVPRTPPGTVLALNGDPLTAAEIDRFAAAIGALEPQYLLVHRRRLALTNVVLPLCALRSLHPAERAAAADEARAALAEGPEALAARASELRGTFRELGLDLWCLARGTPPGSWGGPLELVGRFVLVRLDEAQGAEEEETLALRVVEFPYVTGDLGAAADAALDRSRLEIVDPGWRETIPETWQRRLREP